MEFSPNPQQLLFLWCVAAEPATAVSKLPYKLTPTSSRDELAQLGWIKIEKRSRSKLVTLTESGWYGLEQHLTSPIWSATATAQVLQWILAGVGREIAAGKLSLAAICAERRSASPIVPTKASGTTESANVDPLRQRIYEACRRLSGEGIYNVRIRLADLRSRLADVSRAELDHALKDMEREEVAAFYPLDDPREVRAEDIAAAIANSSGSKRHIVYLSQPY